MTTARIESLAGACNGSNRTFTTPSAYVAGSLRVFVNGVEYASDDTAYGWSEVSTTTLLLSTAPLSGDTIAAFYNEQSADQVLGLDGLQGSPYAPGEVS